MGMVSRILRGRLFPRAVFFVILFVWPVVYPDTYLTSAVMMAGVYALMAISVNLIDSQAGQGSMGHAAFAGIGAYTSALLAVNLQWPPVAALVGSALVTAAVAYLLGRPVLKLVREFLTMATLALVFIFYVLAVNLASITGGTEGIVGIPYFGIGRFEFDSYLKSYYLIWVVVLAVLLFVESFMRSRSGRALRGLAVNEIAASSLGVNVAAWKLRAFVFGSALSGVAGGFLVFFLGACTPGDFGFPLVISIILMVMLGGQASVFAALIGAILITLAQFELASYQQYSSGLFGVLLLVILLAFPMGLVGVIDLTRRERVRRVARDIWKAVYPSSRGSVTVVGNADAVRSNSNGFESESSLASTDQPGGGNCLPLRGDPSGVAVVTGTGRVVSEEGGEVLGGHGHVGAGKAAKVNGSASEEPALVIEGITVRFGGLEAVSDVSMKTEAGQIMALIGPNGAGKTTLFNVLSGLQKPSSGRVFFRGRNVTTLRADQVAKLGMARTFQNLRLFDNMTVLDNVMVGRHKHERSHFLSAGVKWPSQRREESESREAAMRILEFVGLDDRAQDDANSLPYGQQRLVEIARALASEPTLLLLDEPAAGMNQNERDDLIGLVRAIRDAGITVMLVEHNMGLVMNISENIVVLDYGKKICEGDAEKVQCDPRVIEAYLGARHATEIQAEETAADVVPCGVPAKEAANMRGGSVPVAEGTILAVRGVSTYYGAIGAVQDVSLEVQGGEMLAVLGANGAGKTTLLRTISGVLRPRSGHILFEEQDITRLSPRQIVELGVCHVAEGRHVFPTLSVSDNLLLGAGDLHHKGTEYKEALDRVFELFPRLHERRKQSAGSLSGGEQQMLAIGRALMGHPRILLLDEPSMGLAPVLVATIFDSLQALKERGLTVLMVEQNAEVALEIADRVVVLVTGSVALSGSACDLKDDPRIRGLYLGEEAG